MQYETIGTMAVHDKPSRFELPSCLKKDFWQTHTHVLFWGHWYSCFGFQVMSPLGFKAIVGSALFAFVEVNTMYNS